MFKTLTAAIEKEKPKVQARIITNGDKLAAKRDVSVTPPKRDDTVSMADDAENSATYECTLPDQMGMQLNCRVSKEGDVFVAQCLNVDIASDGKTEHEAVSNLNEAISLYFSDDAAAAKGT